MYSSEDLEQFYFQYQTEGLMKGISIQNTVHRIRFLVIFFYKYYKDTCKQVVVVHVDGHPSEVSPLTETVIVFQLEQPPLTDKVRIRLMLWGT